MTRWLITVSTQVEQYAFIEADNEFDALNAAHRDFAEYAAECEFMLDWSDPSSFEPPKFAVEESLGGTEEDLED
jgi:hypothetical protein